MALTDGQLDEFAKHARRSYLSPNPRPLLADRVELLVGEVKRLRGGITKAADDLSRDVLVPVVEDDLRRLLDD